MKQPLALLILDGFGHREETRGNAIRAARTPHLDALFRDNPTTLISCSGLAVGLPEGQMGNSEVGHTNMGAGRVVYQELTRITRAIEQGDFFQNPALLTAVRDARERAGAVHILGLLSDGGVHSHLDHILALVRLAKQEGVERIFLHAFLDGRDVPPTSGADFIRRTQRALDEIGAGAIATVCGRYYAMDRDRHWDRIQRAYDAMVLGEGPWHPDPVEAVESSYAAGKTDEFMEPVVCCKNGTIGKGDSVIFFNFRPDRAREITRTLVDPDFDGFERQGGLVGPHYVCFTQYDASMPHVHVAFQPQVLTNILGEVISQAGMTQLRIAETEKYAHVTFFFNGGEETVFPGEDRVLIDSPKVATFDQKPAMSAYEVTDAVCQRIESGQYDVVILNFANCDMVGHTGVMEAAVEAVEAVDECLGRVLSSVQKMGGVALVTADHGNAEQMAAPDGTPFTAHTTNVVPFIVYNREDVRVREGGRLCDIAPTMLELLGLPQPPEMTGQSLLVKPV